MVHKTPDGKIDFLHYVGGVENLLPQIGSRINSDHSDSLSKLLTEVSDDDVKSLEDNLKKDFFQVIPVPEFDDSLMEETKKEMGMKEPSDIDVKTYAQKRILNQLKDTLQ